MNARSPAVHGMPGLAAYAERMSVVKERLFVEAPFTQACGAFERRLGIPPRGHRGTCILTLPFPIGENHEIARMVTATTERLANPANFTSHYRIGWDSGRTARGLPTPGFTGTLTLSSGENYDETELKLEGGYDPPGGVVGQAFDELLGRRIAHATVAALLTGVGDELREAHEHIEAAKHAH
ncbi:MAG TPA: hypothetical protein VGC72_04325 [Candidatus Elarobacter sp.]